ncbi:hypothetical protein F511_25822 [Dorcoceras hygrometricum]|uniref:Uncharacterized protein n=1 Tax=Dorcoceras hygrometricum TaxID=472368 RepID=A0A2Z7A6W1_9LAMI|nr:hypothetical protein F511_25822 [Dorcoceras hygrometricum]
MGSSPFDPTRKFLESRPLMCDGSVSYFSPVETNEQHLNGTVLDGDASPYGPLNQISQTFGLPELATDFNTNSDLLENIWRPPLIETEFNNFVLTSGDVGRFKPDGPHNYLGNLLSRPARNMFSIGSGTCYLYWSWNLLSRPTRSILSVLPRNLLSQRPEVLSLKASLQPE